MSGTIPFAVASAREIERQNSTGSDRIVIRPIFGDVARVVWPIKAAAEIALIANSNERTAKRWLSGEIDPPPCVVAAMLARIFPERG
jgi:hypothetical protein